MFKSILSCFFLFVSTGFVAAQTDSLLHKDFQYLRQSDAWLTGQNAAALTRLGNMRLSDGRIILTSGKGGFVNYNEAPVMLSVDAGIESFYRLNSRMVLYGHMSYGNRQGRRMAGSAFVNPSRMPFGIVEDSLTNVGNKRLNTYRLVGAVGGDLYRGVAVGVKIDYTAADYAKYKDLRHKNSLLDMTVTAGVYVPLGSVLQLGTNFFYRRNTESLDFSIYGNADKVYKSFIDYGAFVGKIETFGESGYTDKNREMPFFSEYVGLGVQLGVNISPRLTLYQDFSYQLREGYYGKKSSYTISYNQHDSRLYALDSRITFRPDEKHSHSLGLSVDIENLRNFSNSYRIRKEETTSAYYYEYYAPVKLSNKLWTNMSVSYDGHFGMRGLTPTWSWHAGVNLRRREQKSYVYPYYRLQDLTTTQGYVQGERNLFFRKSLLTLTLGFSYGKGSGKPFEDGTFVKPSDKQNPPPVMETYLYREYTYLTAPQYTVNTAVKYAFVFPRTCLKTYIKGDFQHRRCNESNEWMEGRGRTTLQLSVGCTF